MKKDYIKNIEGAERRFIDPQMEVRMEGENDPIIRGVAAVVESRTDLGPFYEEIAKGAFDAVLYDDVRALFNHDPNLILARSKNGQGTLKLSLDERGNLNYEYKTPDRTYARDLQDAIDKGDVSKSSFGFRVESEEWVEPSESNGLDKELRRITKFKRLYDVSPVTYPAYEDTEVGTRSLNGIKKENELRELEVQKMEAEKIRLKRKFNLK